MPYKDKEKEKNYRRLRIEKIRAEFMFGKSCAECGSCSQLEIDHIERKTKKSHRIWSWSKEKRCEELKKCQILCHKCHQEKTTKENLKEHCYSWWKEKRCRCEKCFKAYRVVMGRYNEKRRIKRTSERLSRVLTKV